MSEAKAVIEAYEKVVERAIATAKHIPGLYGLLENDIDEDEADTASLRIDVDHATLIWWKEGEGGSYSCEQEISFADLDMLPGEFSTWVAAQEAERQRRAAQYTADKTAKREAEERRQYLALKAKYEPTK